MTDAESEPASASASDPESAESPEHRAERLKERIYVTFTSLAVILAMSSRADELTASSAALTLLITVLGTLLAVFVADLVAHIVVHQAMPGANELRHMIKVSSSSLGVLVLPMIFIGLAAIGRWELSGALRVAAVALTVTLIAIGYLAARRLRMPMASRLVILFAEFGLGVLVILLELLAHTIGESH